MATLTFTDADGNLFDTGIEQSNDPDFDPRPRYNREAVDRKIRKDRRIKGKEAKLIHALLKGRG